MTKSELIEKYVKIYETENSGFIPVIDDLLTRLLSEYDAQRGVEARNTAVNILGKLGTLFQECVSFQQSGFDQEPEERFDSARWNREGIKIIAALIAPHAPKGLDVEDLWNELYRVSMEKLATNCAGGGILISKLDLAAALGVKGEKG